LRIPRLEDWRQQARALKVEAHAVFLASKDPRVPWYAKALAACVLAYLFSPIDLIPDFIPVIGHLDDLILVPAGLLLVIRLIPADVMAEHREAARVAAMEGKPSWISAVIVVAVWAFLLVFVLGFLKRLFQALN
jgi:uncharacterized membrane protein YkvA (DUF1232 family)